MAKRPSRAQRFEQVEAFLASDMTVAEWCGLNHMSPQTLYRWLDRYAESECPERAAELRPNRSKGQWIELRQACTKEAVAIVAAGEGAERAAAGTEGAAAPQAVAATVSGAEPVSVAMAGATVTVTAATDPAALRLALQCCR